MSAELLENIKRQIDSLTASEKVQLAAFLNEKLEPHMSDGNEADEQDARRRRMRWLKANRQQYGGQYVALEDDTLIAVGRTQLS